jgi:hypothetical protein
MTSGRARGFGEAGWADAGGASPLALYPRAATAGRLRLPGWRRSRGGCRTGPCHRCDGLGSGSGKGPRRWSGVCGAGGAGKVLFILEDVRWLTVHPTDETDAERSEAMLVKKSNTCLEHAERDLRRLTRRVGERRRRVVWCLVRDCRGRPLSWLLIPGIRTSALVFAPDPTCLPPHKQAPAIPRCAWASG